ncbi:MAG TPA: response regulator [Microbacteriaceae bacterium]
MSTRPARVLVVDDEPIAAAAHADYVRRIDGLELAAIAHTGRETLRILRDSITDPRADGAAIDLILLDLGLPDVGGLDLCRRIRSAGLQTDVIAITAVREVASVRSAVALGIVQYLIKPFAFATFADKMNDYVAFRQRFDDSTVLATQSDVDRTFSARRPSSFAQARAQLDKGLTEETLGRVVARLRTADDAASAAEIALGLGISRVTARRYLEYLAELELVERSPRYGAPGRPELEYRLRHDAVGRQ